MRTTLAALTIAAPFFAVAPTLAQDSDASLVGTWLRTEFIGQTATGNRLTPNEVLRSEIVIATHDGPLFAGSVRWELEGEGYGVDDGKQVTNMAEEAIMGIRDLDDDTYVAVELEDTTFRHLRLIDEDTLEVVIYEGGPHALVARATYERQ